MSLLNKIENDTLTFHLENSSIEGLNQSISGEDRNIEGYGIKDVNNRKNIEYTVIYTMNGKKYEAKGSTIDEAIKKVEESFPFKVTKKVVKEYKAVLTYKITKQELETYIATKKPSSAEPSSLLRVH